MEIKELKAREFKQMVAGGAKRLTQNVDLINSLNVFPVPDGDTGTNMNMTFTSGHDHLAKSDLNHVGSLSQVMAKGLLMGARGNSGVILSQIFRGFSKAIEDQASLDGSHFAAAFIGGVESAYKAVMKPVEGTILTVARESALAGESQAKKTDDLVVIMEAIVNAGQKALDSTPDLLPVLKQVGVVDSGGKGLLTIYQGFLSALKGEVLDDTDSSMSEKSKAHAHAVFDEANENPMSMDDITYGYCTEIMVRIGENPTTSKTFDYEDFRQRLNAMGDSLLVVADDEIIKVHVHTENPGKVFQMGQEYGELIKLKVENMREQVRALEKEEDAIQASHLQTPTSPKKKVGILAVAAGQGISDLFTSSGVDHVLAGGQTMNPSTEDIVKAIESIQADSILILPNNKNIIMAAEQATQVVDRPAAVLTTTSIPQGLSSLIAYNPEASLDENKSAMEEAIETVVSGQITYSIRDTEIDQVTIKKDDFMGIIDGKIVLAHSDLQETLLKTLRTMAHEDSEIATILVGQDGDTGIAEAVLEILEEDYPEMEVDILQGDQPVYHYMMFVE